MSRRLAADGRPRKQIPEAAAPGGCLRGREPGAPEAPRRRPDKPNYRRDAGDRAAGALPGVQDEGEPEGRPRFRSESNDFIRTVHKNAFIDSYYPRLRGDLSEDCANSGKSLSSLGDALSKLILYESSLIGDCPESVPRFSATKAEEAIGAFEEWRQSLGSCIKIGSSGCGTLRWSSRSGLTLGSKTYTLRSSVSDDDFSLRRDAATLDRNAEEKEEEGDVAETRSTVAWFAKLYKRIETLEELLEKNLDTAAWSTGSDSKNEAAAGRSPGNEGARSPPLVPPLLFRTPATVARATESAEDARKPGKQKTKFAVRETRGCNFRDDGWQPPPDAAAPERPEDFDTDVELRNIKKRVEALELKLKQWGTDGSSRGDGPLADTDFSSTKSETPETKTGRTRSRDEHRPGIFACGVRRPSDADADVSPNARPPRNSGSGDKEDAIRKKTRKVKQNLAAKCKRIKGMCSSVISFGRKSSPSKNHPIARGFGEVPYKIEGEPSEREVRRHPRTADDAAARVLGPRCRESAPPPAKKLRKRKRKNRKDLCRKTSKTNFLSEWAGGEPPKEERPPPRRSREGSPRRSARCECQGKAGRGRKKPRRSRNPVEVLRRGGRIKIPVLFTEICRTAKSTEPAPKVSSLSIRFVLVEKDSEHPVRKLLKKLSPRGPPRRREQYIFGVSKCCCDAGARPGRGDKRKRARG